MAYQDILKILESTKICSSVQNFIDIYLRLPGIPNGLLTESDCIRVRICEGRFALLIREVCICNEICDTFFFNFSIKYSGKCMMGILLWLLFHLFSFEFFLLKPIREGSFIVQPKVDFDISISTVAGLLNLGYWVLYWCFSSLSYLFVLFGCAPHSSIWMETCPIILQFLLLVVFFFGFFADF